MSDDAGFSEDEEEAAGGGIGSAEGCASDGSSVEIGWAVLMCCCSVASPANAAVAACGSLSAILSAVGCCCPLFTGRIGEQLDPWR